MAITINVPLTILAAALLYWLGNWLVKRISFLRKWCIPAPLVGGLVFAVINTILYGSGAYYFQFNGTIQTLLMIGFFTTVGFTVKIPLLKQGGKAVILCLVLASILTLMQNVLGAAVLYAMGQDPRLGLAVGSISLVGGPGTAAAFGPVLESAGAVGGSVVGISAATFGLVMGSMTGGPVADWLIRKNGITGREILKAENNENAAGKKKLSGAVIAATIAIIAVCMAVSSALAEWFTELTGVTLPWFAAAMLVGATLRNAWGKFEFPDEEAEKIGELCLAGFLSMAMMSLKIWELADLAGPMVVALALQTIMLLAFSYFFVFPRLGRDYDAAVMTAGFIGFAMGATSNAVANMKAVENKYGPSPTAFLVIPLVGGMAIDFVNIFLVTTMIPMLGGLI